MGNNTNSASYRRKYYAKRRNELIISLGGKCVKCGSTKNLEIDHIDPSSKSFCISTKLIHMSRKRISEEASKCQLLCHKCHFEKSRKDIGAKVSGPSNGSYGKTGAMCSFSKPVVDLDTGETFASGKEYAEIHGLSVLSTERVCRGERNSIKGHRPRYLKSRLKI